MRDLSVVTVLLLASFGVHALAVGGGPMAGLEDLYRRAYYVPILYAAWAFGVRGGMTVAIVASVACLAHTLVDPAVVGGGGSGTLVEVALYLSLGGLFGALRDLEGRRAEDLRLVSVQLEEAYRKLEERAIQLVHIQDYTQSILRSITSGVVTVGPDGSVATANPAAEGMIGLREFEIVPRQLSGLFRDDGGLGRDLGKILSGRLPKVAREITMTTLAGRTLHLKVAASRMRAVGGRILGAVVTFEDLSEVRALTAQLIRADRLAAMGELTAGVAHEVRNPLGVIRASVQLIEDGTAAPGRRIEALNVIKQEIDRLDRVIKALLDFGRPTAPVMAPVDLAGVLADVVLFTQRFADRSDVQIVVRLPEGLPKVFGDADQLKQVFLNLVTNGVQMMGEVGGSIAIEGVEDDGFVTVRVTDDGPGIAPEDITKVFDPFYSRREDGTGLGLTIVHRIIDEHDGRIGVRSTLGSGATFTVTLPAARPDRAETEDGPWRGES